jgi:hypothetical protein
LASQEARNTQALDALNTTLRLLTAVIPTQSTALPQPSLPVASATRPKLDLKPSPPPNFDGDRQNGKGFINACQAYFRLRPDQFPDEQTKIQWAMTYMNQGRAQKWANRTYHWEAAPANVGNPHFCKGTLRFALHCFRTSDIASGRLPTRSPLPRSS